LRLLCSQKHTHTNAVPCRPVLCTTTCMNDTDRAHERFLVRNALRWKCVVRIAYVSFRLVTFSLSPERPNKQTKKNLVCVAYK
jgi:hypothetical protein